MTEADDPYAMGPPPGYAPPKPPPSREHPAWLRALRGELARIGAPCGCGHGRLTHIHQTGGTACALCACPAYTTRTTRQETRP